MRPHDTHGQAEPPDAKTCSHADGLVESDEARSALEQRQQDSVIGTAMVDPVRADERTRSKIVVGARVFAVDVMTCARGRWH
jgi:hypothetical protein